MLCLVWPGHVAHPGSAISIANACIVFVLHTHRPMPRFHKTYSFVFTTCEALFLEVVGFKLARKNKHDSKVPKNKDVSVEVKMPTDTVRQVVYCMWYSLAINIPKYGLLFEMFIYCCNSSLTRFLSLQIHCLILTSICLLEKIQDPLLSLEGSYVICYSSWQCNNLLSWSKYPLSLECFIWDLRMPSIHYKTMLPALVILIL